MARKPRPDRDSAGGQPADGDAHWVETCSDRGRPISAEADEAVLRLARLVGRQIAREQFEGQPAITQPRPRRLKDAP